MFDFIIKKFVPFGLARTLSLAGIPLLQFAVMIFSSKEDAGKFYFISNAAFVASQLADIGMSRAFPVLFGTAAQKTHEQLPEIMIARSLLSIVLGLVFVLINSFGEISWTWSTTGLIAFFFCVGRVILLGNQGFRHARQEYTLLLRGACLHIAASLSFLAICSFYGRFNADIAFAALTLGIWVELIAINSPQAHPFAESQNCFKRMMGTAGPFMTVGIANAVYGRVETFVAGQLLAPGVLGIFGTLDSAFKICIWPSYVSAQTVFPAVNEAIKKQNSHELKLVAKRHFRLGAAICLVAMLASLVFWYLKFYGDTQITIAAMFLWFSIWMAVPNAFMIPLFYSLGLEALLAKAMLQLAALRTLVAIVLAIHFNFVGLCATHAIVTLCAVLLLYYHLRAILPDIFKTESAAAQE